LLGKISIAGGLVTVRFECCCFFPRYCVLQLHFASFLHAVGASCHESVNRILLTTMQQYWWRLGWRLAAKFLKILHEIFKFILCYKRSFTLSFYRQIYFVAKLAICFTISTY